MRCGPHVIIIFRDPWQLLLASCCEIWFCNPLVFFYGKAIVSVSFSCLFPGVGHRQEFLKLHCFNPWDFFPIRSMIKLCAGSQNPCLSLYLWRSGTTGWQAVTDDQKAIVPNLAVGQRKLQFIHCSLHSGFRARRSFCASCRRQHLHDASQYMCSILHIYSYKKVSEKNISKINRKNNEKCWTF